MKAAIACAASSAEPAARALAEEALGPVRYLERSGSPVQEFALVTQELSTGALAGKLAELSAKGVQLLSKIRVLDKI